MLIYAVVATKEIVILKQFYGTKKDDIFHIVVQIKVFKKEKPKC